MEELLLEEGGGNAINIDLISIEFRVLENQNELDGAETISVLI